MAIVLVNTTTAVTGAAATSLAINVPAGVSNDDLLLLVGVSADGDTDAPGTPPPESPHSARR